MKWFMDRRTFIKTVGASATAAFTGGERLAGSLRSSLSLQNLFDTTSIESDEIALFGVGSEGVVEQWDGQRTPRGILLRWFARPELGFPDYGYDVYRSRPPKSDPLPMDGKKIDVVDGKQAWIPGQVFVEPPTGLTFQQVGSTSVLSISAGRSVGLRFAEPAWYLRIQAVGASMGRVKAYRRGVVRLEHRFAPGALDVEWCTRGVDRIELIGPVQIASIEYRFLDPALQWDHVKHLCLPVTHPDYRCRPQPTTPDDAAEAESRIPTAGLWSAKYQKIFAEMYSSLRALAGRETPPEIPSTPIGQPDGPRLELEPLVAVHVAALDPHVARVLGIAWDDPLPRGLDGEIYGYKVVGRWWREPVRSMTTNLAASDLEATHGIKFEAVGGTVGVVGGALRVRLSAGDLIRFTFPEAMDSVLLDMPRRTRVRWRATNQDPPETRTGVVPFTFWPRFQTRTSIVSSGMRVLEFVGPATFEIRLLSWITVPWVKRTGILPGIRAQESGPPRAPAWMTASVRQPVGTAAPTEAALDWEVRLSDSNLYEPEGAIFYQLAAAQMSTDPAVPMPTVPRFAVGYLLLDRDWIVVPPPLAAAWPPRELHIDRGTKSDGLSEGWRCWWARGVDLFGRVSAPTPPAVRKIEDVALPPAPVLLWGEYVQADLVALQGPTGAQSPFARDWLSANPGADAFIVSWAWTPELNEQCPDVDGFRILTRRAATVANPGPNEPSITYDSVPWSTPIASIGPVPVRFDGQLTALRDGIASTFSVTTVIEKVVGREWQCATSLALQTGGGALNGGTLVDSSGTTWTITGHGESANVTLFVSGPSAPPSGGGYSIRKGSTDVVEVFTNINIPPDPSPLQRRIGGLLEIGEFRFLVLHAANGRFVCRTGPVEPGVTLPSSGAASWYPAYAFAIADQNLGPQPSLTTPVAYGQITVRTVRRWSSRPLESPPAEPASLRAVDVTEPVSPSVPSVVSGEHCAELASRADWYGVSRFTLNWAADPALSYMVYRALGDAIERLDLEAHTIPPPTSSDAPQARAHAFAQADWIPEIWTDTARRQQVLNDLAALDAALAAAVPLPVTNPTRRTQIAAAYDALHADSHRVLAFQPYARGAFTARFGRPISAAQYVDEIDGRSRARWFYRIASRTPAGLESEWTPPTPPICCPDVVPPSTPQVMSALGAVGRVRLRWLASPESDVKLYRIYRTQDEKQTVDIRLMDQGEAVSASPEGPVATGLEVPSPVLEGDPPTARQGWLQFAAAAPNAGTWYFRLVAEDSAGNRSRHSNLLRGVSLRPDLVPPAWTSASRSPSNNPTEVRLTWTHPDDQRLSCIVERRYTGSSAWRAVIGWLPRGVYSFNDTPVLISAGIEYRVKGRDVEGRVAPSGIISVAPLS